MNSAHAWRFNLIGTLFSLFAAVIVGQLFLIQTNPETVAKFREWNEIYEGWSKTVYPARGEIYDRWGHLLAGNTTVYEIGVTRSEVQNPHTIALTLNVVLGLDYNTVFNEIDPQASNGGIYVVLDDFVTEDRVERLQALADEMSKAYAGSREKDPPSLAGLTFQPHLQRSYPEKSLASNLLGFVGGEGHGFFGVEAKFDSLLAGQPTRVWMPNDPNLAGQLPEIPEGASLILTIDREIQRAMEAVVDDAVDETGAESATLVVMDPQRGEILAMATTPRLDLNEYWNYAKVFPDSTPFNRAISQDYEPGSVFKVLTLAAGLDSGAIQPDSTFLDTGVFEIGGTLIYNWNGGAWGPQDMQGCMQHSLNVCLAWIATQTGAKNFYAYMNAFGIGHETGVDLAGEVTGRLKAPGDSDWYDADLGTNSFGQGVSATPLQMAAAASALANDGKLFAPRIVRSIVNDGHQFDTEPQLIGMPIKPETARTATELLARSLEEEASVALVDGYRVAGKTGTAEIPTPYGYTSNVTNTSFVGWGPVDDPRFVVYVWLEKPQTSIWGSEVAAPVFAQAVNELVVLLDLPPDSVRQQLAGNQE